MLCDSQLALSQAQL